MIVFFAFALFVASFWNSAGQTLEGALILLEPYTDLASAFFKDQVLPLF